MPAFYSGDTAFTIIGGFPSPCRITITTDATASTAISPYWVSARTVTVWTVEPPRINKAARWFDTFRGSAEELEPPAVQLAARIWRSLFGESRLHRARKKRRAFVQQLRAA